jgi:hypothetical protein
MPRRERVAGHDSRIHLITAAYYWIGRNGDITPKKEVYDFHQGTMDFPPAVSTGWDGVDSRAIPSRDSRALFL